MATPLTTPEALLRWAYVTPFAGQDRPDVAWWRGYWRRLGAQGVVLPARESVETSRARAFASLTAAARSDGLRVLARLDNGVLESAAPSDTRAAIDATGKLISAAGGIAACVNRAAFQSEAAATVAALVTQHDIDGVLGVGWSGLDRGRICSCPECAQGFKAASGLALPAAADVDSPDYWAWADWNRRRRTDLWRTLDAAARRAGAALGWTGLSDLDRVRRAYRFQDLRATAGGASLLFLEATLPSTKGRFRLHLDNARDATRLAQGRPVVLLSPTHLDNGRGFPLVGGAAPETRLKLMAGLAGGAGVAISQTADPTLDRRAAEIAPPVLAFHKAHAPQLQNRAAVGAVGLVWSGNSADRYGRAHSAVLSQAPYRGMVAALVRNHIPYQTVDAEDLTGDLSGFQVLILPNVAAMSTAEVAAVRTFVREGGALVATNETSLYDLSGAPLADFALGDVFGVHRPPGPVDRLASLVRVSTRAGAPTGVAAAEAFIAAHGASVTPASAGPGARTAVPPPVGRTQPGQTPNPASLGLAVQHNFVRLHPQRAAATAGAHVPNEPLEPGPRHPVLAGFDNTDLLPFGGALGPLLVEPDRTTLLTYIPPFPSLPSDENYIREDRLDCPGLVVGAFGRGRVAFVPAEFDRRLGIDPLIDHHALMANILKWAIGSELPITIEGRASLAASLHRQPGQLILHLVNLTGADNQSQAVTQLTPVGPLSVSLDLPAEFTGRGATLATSSRRLQTRLTKAGGRRRLAFEVPSVVDQELIVIQ